MEAKAVAKYIRMSPRKARLVVDQIRGRNAQEAMAILKMTPNKPAEPIYKVLHSAVANAEHNYEMNKDNLYVAQAFVDQGPVLKRFRPRARGMASRIRKPTSHITIVLRENKEG
ncbi:50S ribosomal protein L22 [Dethiobacter alkaliphilus]|uniref:Large ribosomal subunit protein uL22 n=1 Tax=Dethiobacter alkaliphilus AHT 1 TaxID=555088 RepID=C0GGA9_DETAL|nr:50S ribosomal protein L22 [Dethiobacter alkaliphilus]EEG77798.1 ribosomal protein L22 [Dethiobacter alkaliphilus AHT 1]MCW3491088.1 50S ribosomal protein L22 [Dethiobacter alkaliphilus]